MEWYRKNKVQKEQGEGRKKSVSDIGIGWKKEKTGGIPGKKLKMTRGYSASRKEEREVAFCLFVCSLTLGFVCSLTLAFEKAFPRMNGGEKDIILEEGFSHGFSHVFCFLLE